jgi:hypothetical protein
MESNSCTKPKDINEDFNEDSDPHENQDETSRSTQPLRHRDRQLNANIKHLRQDKAESLQRNKQVWFEVNVGTVR